MIDKGGGMERVEEMEVGVLEGEGEVGADFSDEGLGGVTMTFEVDPLEELVKIEEDEEELELDGGVEGERRGVEEREDEERSEVEEVNEGMMLIGNSDIESSSPFVEYSK
jgi:hypothetical protein